MKIVTVSTLQKIIREHGLKPFLVGAIDDLENAFAQWESFEKTPRLANHYDAGVMELMPCANDDFYAFKFVNGHPGNPKQGKLSVIAIGLLAETKTGYPLLLSEMTMLTAFRTAATTALAAKYLARSDSRTVSIVGTGAQAEFQILALQTCFEITAVKYFDIDRMAMAKFATNLQTESFELIPCKNLQETVSDTDILITATADKRHNPLITETMLSPGLHIHGLGGDCPGKTEFHAEVLPRCKVVVEYLPQSLSEGEIQQGSSDFVHAELWELINQRKLGRESDAEITFFDSVGFALEDFSILQTLHRMVKTDQSIPEINLIPQLSDPKNLFGLLV